MAPNSRRILALIARDLALDAHERAHGELAAYLPVVAVMERGRFSADLRGTERLLGPAERVARRALELAGASFSAGIAGVPFVAALLAERTASGAVGAIGPHEERAFLAALPIDVLPLEPAVVEEFALLGLRRVGDFASLPRASVLDRFGVAAAHARALACGEDLTELRATPPAVRLAAARRWDGAIDALEPLLFALRGLTDELGRRLGAAGLAALRLDARFEREDDHPLRFERVVLPPAAEPASLLRSLRWALEERYLLGRVTGVEVVAIAVEPARGRQLGLFAPDGARREDAQTVAAYLRARLGAGRVLRPRVVDDDPRLPERAAEFEEVVS